MTRSNGEAAGMVGGDLDGELVTGHAGALVDVGAYLARLIRLDPRGVVRVRQTTQGRVTLWAMPLGVLTRRDVLADLGGTADTTLSATDLLARVEPAHDSGADRVGLPAARDAAWRASLPPPSGWELVDTVPGAALLRSADQAAETVRATPNPTVAGEALLDHPALLVSAGDSDDGVPAGSGVLERPAAEVEISQRMVQVATRMGFVAGDEDVRVATSGRWVAVAARNGAVYRRTGAPNLLTLS